MVDHQAYIYIINILIYLKIRFMQCWFISNVGNMSFFFQDYLMNKKLNKNSIYLKYNFCNNIHYQFKACIFFKQMYFNSAMIC